ncbi:protein of unknown function (DUF1693) [Dermatophagoides farinae]|uniref:polynucleotide adenylyltransferase n=1 Tax=Dermatophagoides farinae TaxID=6954 RepID=A0A922HYE5_DERFA|nr:protein of unknown function (DUF1693) [Dermatophagoides farinae]
MDSMKDSDAIAEDESCSLQIIPFENDCESTDRQLISINHQTFDLRDKRFGILNPRQTKRLKKILKKEMSLIVDFDSETSFDKKITNYCAYPLHIFLQIIGQRLTENNITYRDIRLNGGAASYVLNNRNKTIYNDIDIIFNVNLQNESYFESIRKSIFKLLLDICAPNILEPDIRLIREQVLTKMVKISDNDTRWSLFSIKNFKGCTIEIKFVDKIRRQYEFSVDSFQIILDNVLDDPCIADTIICESVFGDYHEAIYHLNNKFIVTNSPEKIRGGGLFKYCFLLVRDFKPLCHETMKKLEPYMVSRFFIDFTYFECQRDKLCNYLLTHFGNDTMSKYHFLTIFCSVLKRSLKKNFNQKKIIKKYMEITTICFCTLLREFIDNHQFFDQHLTNEKPVNGYDSVNQCLNKELVVSNQTTRPILVTFVFDNIQPNISKLKRQQNLINFIKCHDNIYPKFGGYSFALLPAKIFHSINANNLHSKHEHLNHYIISYSTLYKMDHMFYKLNNENIYQHEIECNSNLFIDQCSSFNSIQNFIYEYQSNEILTKRLPDSLFPVDFSYSNITIDKFSQIPFSPPKNYRLCILNKTPIIYNESIESGIMNKSMIVNNIIKSLSSSSSSSSQHSSCGSNVILHYDHSEETKISSYQKRPLLSINSWQQSITIPCDAINSSYPYQNVWNEYQIYSSPLSNQQQLISNTLYEPSSYYAYYQ